MSLPVAISAVPKGQATPGAFLGWGQAQLGTGCQQDVTGQCHATAGGAGLALLPEQMAAGEVGLCPSNVHPSLGASEHQGPARVPTTAPGKVTVPGVSSNPRELPQPSPPGRACPVVLVRQLPPCARRDRPVLPMWVQSSPQILHSPTARCQAVLPGPATTQGRAGAEEGVPGAPPAWHKPCVHRGVISPSGFPSPG